MNDFPRNKKDWTAYLLASAVSVGLIYAAVYVEDGTLELRLLRTVTRILQAAARIVGRWGLITERLYFHVLDNSRMV